MERRWSVRINLALFVISQKVNFFLGLAPYKIAIQVSPADEVMLDFKCSPSKLGSVYNISLLIIIIATMILVVPEILGSDYSENGSLGKTIDIALSITGNLFAILIIFIYLIQQQTLVEIGNDLSKFRGECRVDLSSNGKKRKYDFYYVTVIILFLLFVILLVPVSVMMEQSWASFSSMCCVVMFNCCIIEYSMTIKVLKGSMEDLNEALARLCKYPVDEPAGLLYLNDLRNYREVNKNLTRLRRARTTLGRLSTRVADFHALPSLLIIFYCCCYCVDVLYFLIIDIIDRKLSLFYILTLYDILWILFVIYPIVILAGTIKRFNGERERTADVLYEVRETYIINKEITSELSDFGVELLHKKVVFSAYGLFPLDCTLLYSIFGMIVTYLIILLQFRPSVVPRTVPQPPLDQENKN